MDDNSQEDYICVKCRFVLVRFSMIDSCLASKKGLSFYTGRDYIWSTGKENWPRNCQHRI